jgi:hypothetical protein
MARVISKSTQFVFILYSAVILVLGTVLILEKMPDGNQAFERSVEKTLANSAIETRGECRDVMGLMIKLIAAYRNVGGYSLYEEAYKSEVMIDSFNLIASQALMSTPDNHAPTLFLDKLSAKFKVINDSIVSQNSIVDPEYKKIIKSIFDNAIGHGFQNADEHWRVYTGQINAAALQMERSYLYMVFRRTSCCDIKFDPFWPDMYSPELFPIAGQPFEMDFFLANTDELLLEPNIRCYVNEKQIFERSLRYTIDTTFKQPGPQTFHVTVKRRSLIPQPDITADFHLTVPPPCPPPN